MKLRETRKHVNEAIIPFTDVFLIACKRVEKNHKLDFYLYGSYMLCLTDLNNMFGDRSVALVNNLCKIS